MYKRICPVSLLVWQNSAIAIETPTLFPIIYINVGMLENITADEMSFPLLKKGIIYAYGSFKHKCIFLLILEWLTST